MEEVARFAVGSFDRRWEASRGTRPTHFADGRPFEPDPLIETLRAAYWRACFSTDVDRDPDLHGITFLMMVMAELGTTEPSMAFTTIVLKVRQSMLARGAEAEERAVSAFALYLTEYWQASGAFQAFIASMDGMTEEQLRQMP